MQLREIRLRNIRSYPEARLQLSPGTTLITGDVGSGKTSLLYAIEMALFGFAEVDPAYLVRHASGEAEVALALEDGDDRFEVVRRFRRVVQRGREGFRPTESLVVHNGQRTRYSPTELRQRAIDLLGFPDNPNPTAHSDLWRWAVYVPQEQMREVLSGDASDRLETVRKALSLEQYRIAAENAQTLARDLDHRGAEFAARAEGLRPAQDSLPTWTGARAERERTVVATQALADAQEAEALQIQLQIDRVDSDLAERESARREAVRIGGEVERARRSEERASAEVGARAAQLAEWETDAAPLEDRRAALHRSRDEIQRAEGERQGTDQRLSALEEQRRDHARWEAETRSLEEAVRAAVTAEGEAKHRSETEERAGVEAERQTPLKAPPMPTRRSLEEIDRGLAELGGRTESTRLAAAALEQRDDAFGRMVQEGRCPTCGQSVDASSVGTHRDELGADLVTARRKLEECEAALETLRGERKARERYERNLLEFELAERRRREVAQRRTAAAADLERARERRRAAVAREAEARARRDAGASLGAEHEGLREHQEELDHRLKGLNSKVREQERELEKAEAAAGRIEPARLDLDRARKEAGRITEEAAQLRVQQAAAERLLEQLPALRAERATLEAERRRLRERQREFGERLGSARAELDEAERRIAEGTRAAEQRGRLLGQRDHLQALARWLTGPFREGLQTLEHRLLAQAREEFDRYLARYFATLIEDPALTARLDAAFAPEVEIEGEWTPAEALSGGERTALALAYRLALGQVVRKAGRLRLETLLLDEPTDGFSPEQVQRMGELLEELGIPQVLLVSHEAGLASVADAVVRVEKREGRSVLAGSGVSPSNHEASPPVAPRRRRDRSRALEELTEPRPAS